MQFKFKRFVFILPFVCLLAACGKGLDKKLDTTGNDDAFNASFWAANKDMTQADKDAWSWAVSDLSINNIRSKYQDGTPRDVIRGEARDVLANALPRIAKLEVSKKQYDETLKQLNSITASNVALSPSKDSQRHLEFDLHNGSQLPVSRLKWKAWLYINDSTDPVASTFLYDRYDHGLAAGANEHRRYETNDIITSGWDTLDVRNAKSTRVVVQVDPDSVEDFSDNRYMAGAPYDELNRLQGGVNVANKYVNY
jgi:hypothetical protein